MGIHSITVGFIIDEEPMKDSDGKVAFGLVQIKLPRDSAWSDRTGHSLSREEMRCRNISNVIKGARRRKTTYHLSIILSLFVFMAVQCGQIRWTSQFFLDH